MLRPSKKLVLALEAVTDIAYHGGVEPVQSQDIARRLNLPRRYLEQVMQQLVRAGILRGVRGPRGGYRLARERRRITLGEITRVVMAMGDGGDDEDAGAGSDLGQRVVRPLWEELHEETLRRLDGITIESLCLRAREAGLESESVRNLDFSI